MARRPSILCWIRSAPKCSRPGVCGAGAGSDAGAGSLGVKAAAGGSCPANAARQPCQLSDAQPEHKQRFDAPDARSNRRAVARHQPAAEHQPAAAAHQPPVAAHRPPVAAPAPLPSGNTPASAPCTATRRRPPRRRRRPCRCGRRGPGRPRTKREPAQNVSMCQNLPKICQNMANFQSESRTVPSAMLQAWCLGKPKMPVATQGMAMVLAP